MLCVWVVSKTSEHIQQVISLKILIVNYRYFVSGGPERYLFNLKKLLEDAGHCVIPFSVAYDANTKSEYDTYFASPLSNGKEVYFKQHSWSLRVLGRTLTRSFYSREVYDKLCALISDTTPDYAIVLHYLRKLSPAVLKALHDKRIPFVVRLSDFAMICANAHLYRKGKPCELCVQGSRHHSLRYKCVQSSLAASAVEYLATSYHHMRGFFDLIPYFVIPSRFALSRMVAAGWPESKLVQIPTFVNVTVNDEPKNGLRVIYFGRIESSKGVHILLAAINEIKTIRTDLTFDTVLVGNGDNAYRRELANYVDEHHLSRVELRNQLPAERLYPLVQSSSFSVCPSLLYDNMPNSVLESLALGTPVVASNHGSLSEVVMNGKTGVLFAPGNISELASAIVFLLDRPELCRRLGQQAIQFVMEHHSGKRHLDALLGLLHSQKSLAPVSSKE